MLLVLEILMQITNVESVQKVKTLLANWNRKATVVCSIIVEHDSKVRNGDLRFTSAR